MTCILLEKNIQKFVNNRKNLRFLTTSRPKMTTILQKHSCCLFVNSYFVVLSEAKKKRVY